MDFGKQTESNEHQANRIQAPLRAITIIVTNVVHDKNIVMYAEITNGISSFIIWLSDLWKIVKMH